MATSLFVTNAIVFGIGILYFKNKLPNQIKRSVDFVFSFEVSQRIVLIVVCVLLVFYVVVSTGELATEKH